MRRSIVIGIGLVFAIVLIGIAVYDQHISKVEAQGAPPQAPNDGRLIELGSVTGTNNPVTFGLMDVSDCDRVTLMATGQIVDFVSISYIISPDGVTPIAGSPNAQTGGANGIVAENIQIVAPFMQVVVGRAATTSNTITGWIWCEF